MFPFCIGTGVGSAGVRPAFSAGGSAPFGRLSRRTVGRGAALPKAQITLLGGIGILLIPGSILLPHLPTHHVRPKMCRYRKKTTTAYSNVPCSLL